MNISRRIFIASVGSAPILPLLAQRALAAYPDRKIHLIVPFAAGGNADIVGRITGDLISKALGRPVVGIAVVAAAASAPNSWRMRRRTATRSWSDQTDRSPSTRSFTPILAMTH